MRELLQRLAEAAPEPGSKAWLAGVRKWWGQWVKDAERVAAIRDPQDRDKVLAWFMEGEQRIAVLIDALVRTSGGTPLQDLAKVVVPKLDVQDMGGLHLSCQAR
jgi:hypothetical protein